MLRRDFAGWECRHPLEVQWKTYLVVPVVVWLNAERALEGYVRAGGVVVGYVYRPDGPIMAVTQAFDAEAAQVCVDRAAIGAADPGARQQEPEVIDLVGMDEL